MANWHNRGVAIKDVDLSTTLAHSVLILFAGFVSDSFFFPKMSLAKCKAWLYMTFRA
jgi:hypothetical protein